MFQPVISYWCNTPKTLNTSSNNVFLVSAYPIYDPRLLDLLRFKKNIFCCMELRLLINVIKVTTVQKKPTMGKNSKIKNIIRPIGQSNPRPKAKALCRS